MSEWRLVPYEPTPDMVEAALEGHMPFGDMDLAIRLAILAAPPYEELASGRQAGATGVQSEPVGEIRFDLGVPSVAYAELYSETLPSLAPGTKLYAAQRPAEHVSNELALDAAKHLTNWLETDSCECEGGHYCGYNGVKKTRDALLEVVARPQPDVAALVKALEEIENWALRYTSRGKDHPIASTARKAIDAHRKQGGDV